MIIAKIILVNLNTILLKIGYHFELVFNVKYILLALFLIITNIYIAVLIPSVKAGTTSIMQQIRGNKSKKIRNGLLFKVLPIEGKLAIKNIKSNRNKYRIITILLVICITSYISISTYISYARETANLINEYDVDAELLVNHKKYFLEELKKIDKSGKLISNYEENEAEYFDINYEDIFNEYERKYSDKINYIVYKKISPNISIRPLEAIIYEQFIRSIWMNGFDGEHDGIIYTELIGLDNDTYNRYIKKLNAKNGDIIIFNNVTDSIRSLENEESSMYTYNPILKDNINFSLNIALYDYNIQTYKGEYKVINSPSIKRDYVLTRNLLEGFSEYKTVYRFPAIFVDMETYHNIIKDIQESDVQDNFIVDWDYRDMTWIKINCNDVANFKTYMEDYKSKNNIDISVRYYSLENQEKVVYIDIIQLLLKTIIVAIVIIGIISTINVINASLVERKEDFNILYRLGSTKGNIRKILIYEDIYMFIKSTVISILLSIPIIYKIIKEMKSVFVTSELLIPFGKIGLFIGMLFVISILIMIYSSKMIKEE